MRPSQGRSPWPGRLATAWITLVVGIGPLLFLGRSGGKAMLAGFWLGAALGWLVRDRPRWHGLTRLTWVPGLWIVARDTWAFPYGGHALWAAVLLPTGAVVLGVGVWRAARGGTSGG